MRWIVGLLLVVVALPTAALAWLGIPATGAGLAAKTLCSGVFVAGRAPADVLEHDVLPASALLHLVDLAIDAERRLVRARMLWSRERSAVLLPSLGCVLDPTPALLKATAHAGAAAAGGARRDSAETAPPWPATDWAGIDRGAIAAVVAESLRNRDDAAGRNTRAVLILQRGRLVAERYGPGFDAATPQIGWSMSKTVLGLLVYKALEERDQSAAVRAINWAAPDRSAPWLRDWQADERSAITLSDLLFMRDGLDHQEGYEPWSAVPRMLWGVADAAAYAGSAPAATPPGQRFRYLSATANILSGLLRSRFDADPAYWRYPATALFERIGASSAVFEADASGTFVGSSYLWATPRDWARIGQALLRDKDWLQFATAPPPSGEPAAMAYGAQVWLAGTPQGSTCGAAHGLPADTILLAGHWGQLMAMIPSREAVIVRLGMTTDRTRFDRCGFIRSVVQALPGLPDLSNAAPDTTADAMPGPGARMSSTSGPAAASGKRN